MSRNSESTGDWLMNTVSRNPEGLLLLAAGAALLMRKGPSLLGTVGGSSTRQRGQHGGQRHQGAQRHQGGGQRGQAQEAGWTDGVSRAAQSARDYASDVTDRVTETASSYASAVTGYASDASRAMTEHSGRYARQAQSTVSDTVGRVVQEQPLAIVLAGLAAGAAVAATFPATDLERRTLGQAGEALTDYASNARNQLRDATYAAGEKLVSSVEERGLSTDNLKDVARDVAGTFGSSFSGEGPAGQSSQAGQRSAGGSTGAQSGGPSGKQPGGQSASPSGGQTGGQSGGSSAGQSGTARAGSQAGRAAGGPNGKPGRSDVSGSGA